MYISYSQETEKSISRIIFVKEYKTFIFRTNSGNSKIVSKYRQNRPISVECRYNNFSRYNNDYYFMSPDSSEEPDPE